MPSGKGELIHAEALEAGGQESLPTKCVGGKGIADGAVGGVHEDGLASFGVLHFDESCVGENLFGGIVELECDKVMPLGQQLKWLVVISAANEIRNQENHRALL